MITEAILSLFLGLGDMFLNMLPSLNFTIPGGVLSVTTIMFNGIGYVLPVADLLPILFFSILFDNFHVVWSIILRIKSFIPTMGA